MITDTCCCGAELSLKFDTIYSEREEHAAWLKAHEVCRNAKAQEYGFKKWCASAGDLQ
jgi:hypothetical protein